MISKLSNKYPVKNPVGKLTGDYINLDPVFAGRLANVCPMILTESYRSSERQAGLYNQYLEYKRTGKGSIKSAAKPGTSWHEFRLAVDTSTQPIRGMTNAQLKPYGLCKPISSEGWHIQPIETLGQTDRKKWEPTEDDMTKQEVIEIINEILKGSTVSPQKWSQEALQWAVSEEILSDDKTPDRRLTKEEIVTILYRFKKVMEGVKK